jgi:dolichol-phosphate mannosyltransferase
MKKLISVVVSLYNEEGNIEKLYNELLPVLKKCNDVDFEILLVNDGSKDSTLLKCKKIILEDARFKIEKAFHNFWSFEHPHIYLN